MKRKLIMYAMVCTALGGCMTQVGMNNLDTVKSRSIEVGYFTLGKDTPSIEDLLRKLSQQVPKVFENHGFVKAEFRSFSGQSWGELRFDVDYRYWLLGIQFYRSPKEQGKQVVATIRTVGSVDVGPLDPNDLDPLLPKIAKALAAAQSE